MLRKAFHVGIDLDLHAVTCPGVWLCPKGGAMLRISMLGASAHTKQVEPTFPMLFHDSFHFRKTLTGITSLAGLQAELARRLVHIQLLQWQVHGCRCVLLAAFCSPLAELLYPQKESHGTVTGVDVHLLMESTNCFPGIIAPKIEVSTKVVIEEMVNYPIHDQGSVIVNHKTLTSQKKLQKRDDLNKCKGVLSKGLKSKMRQKPVCHTRPRVKCNNCKQQVDWMVGSDKDRRERAGANPVTHISPNKDKSDILYLPYCNKCGDVVQETQVKQGRVVPKEPNHFSGVCDTTCSCVEHSQRSKSACDCNLCRKYNNLFKHSVSSPTESNYSKNKNQNRKHDRSLSPGRRDKCCPCECKSDTSPPRLRAGVSAACPCSRLTSWAHSDKHGSANQEKIPRERSINRDYQNLFKTDLDSHYKRLYERVSRKSNQQ